MFRTHVVFSFLLGLLFLKFFHLSNFLLFLLIVLVASGLPDLDTGKSVISRKTRLVSWIFRIFRHRGIMHSLFFTLLLFLVFLFFSQKEIALGILVGYGSHLFLDSLTKEGIQLFYPFSFRLKGFLKTNGLFEKVLFYVLLVISVYVVVVSLYSWHLFS